jgi:hypothetical protein
MAVWCGYWSFGVFPVLVCLDQEKSGNPEFAAFVHDDNSEKENYCYPLASELRVTRLA